MTSPAFTCLFEIDFLGSLDWVRWWLVCTPSTCFCWKTSLAVPMTPKLFSAPYHSFFILFCICLQPVGLNALGVRYQKSQLVKLQLWRTNKNNFLFCGGHHSMRTVLRGYSFRKVINHCFRVCWMLILQGYDLLRLKQCPQKNRVEYDRV